MYYSKLRAFHAVAIHGGFSKAAKQLSLTQPTLSDQVGKLERDFDILLFNRTSRLVTLTEAGKHLLSITSRMFECEAEALEFLNETWDLQTGTLTISADAPFHILKVVREFRARFPGVDINIKSGNSEEILQQLLEFEADIGVLSRVPEDSRLQSLCLREDPLVAVVSKDHHWAKKRAIRFSDLADQPLVLRERGSTTRLLMEQEFARQRIRPGAVMEIEGRENLREAVAMGNCVGIVSKPEFGYDNRLKMLALEGCDLPMHEYMVCLENRSSMRLVAAFWDMAV
jgi:aminoethylphosphonate catabolism LysR family transcriptional regulator